MELLYGFIDAIFGSVLDMSLEALVKIVGKIDI